MASASSRRLPAEISGWHKLSPAELRARGLSPTSRQYENLFSHKIIPRRQYVDMQAQQLGWKDWADYQYASKQAGGLGGMRSEEATAVNWSLQLADRRRGEPNVPNVRSTQERHTFLRTHAATLQTLRRAPTNKAAHGPLATWLEALGIREQNAPYAVGDTPHTRRNRQ